MSSTEALFARYGPAYRWIATVTALVAAIAVILSATIVNVAIPDVMGAFGIDQVKAQWLSTGFLAAMTATMLLTDWAERAFGQRESILAALATFRGGSVLGGLAPDENVLILARVIQGAAAAIVQPLAMIMVFQVFPPERRGAAMGIFGIGIVLAPALGPWVGGLLMDSFNWRYVFYLGVPLSWGAVRGAGHGACQPVPADAHSLRPSPRLRLAGFRPALSLPDDALERALQRPAPGVAVRSDPSSVRHRRDGGDRLRLVGEADGAADAGPAGVLGAAVRGGLDRQLHHGGGAVRVDLSAADLRADDPGDDADPGGPPPHARGLRPRPRLPDRRAPDRPALARPPDRRRHGHLRLVVLAHGRGRCEHRLLAAGM